MSRSTDAPSRMEILVLSALARVPMHGYDIKTELRYKHVGWWAKCDHGHLYATLARLERKGHVAPRSGGGRRKVYALTPRGRERLAAVLEEVGRGPDATYFDVDLFVSAAFALDQRRVIAILEDRALTLEAQLAEAEALVASMSPYVPAAGRLVMEHRLGHLRREIAFTRHASDAFRTQATWGAYLGTQPIDEFVARTSVPLEDDG